MNDCEAYDTVKILFTINTGFTGYATIPDIKIYPNPAKEILFIELAETADMVEIKDITGKLIFRQQQLSRGKHRINISDFKRGIYFITVKTQTGTVNRKIVFN
jgi:aminopeptidase YwaD